MESWRRGGEIWMPQTSVSARWTAMVGARTVDAASRSSTRACSRRLCCWPPSLTSSNNQPMDSSDHEATAQECSLRRAFCDVASKEVLRHLSIDARAAVSIATPRLQRRIKHPQTCPPHCTSHNASFTTRGSAANRTPTRRFYSITRRPRRSPSKSPPSASASRSPSFRRNSPPRDASRCTRKWAGS